MSRCILDIAQRSALVEGQRDERVAQLVGVEVGEPDLLAEARDELAGVLARQAGARPRDQQGPFARPAAARSTASLTDGLSGTGVAFVA